MKEHDKYNCEECENNMTDSYTTPISSEKEECKCESCKDNKMRGVQMDSYVKSTPKPVDKEEVGESVNYMQAGQTVACGHCDERFIEGLKQMEKLNMKCECKCHTPPLEVKEGSKDIEWKESYNIFVKDVREYGEFPEVLASHIEDFISSLLSNQTKLVEERVRREEREKISNEVFEYAKKNGKLRSIETTDVLEIINSNIISK